MTLRTTCLHVCLNFLSVNRSQTAHITDWEIQAWFPCSSLFQNISIADVLLLHKAPAQAGLERGHTFVVTFFSVQVHLSRRRW